MIRRLFGLTPVIAFTIFAVPAAGQDRAEHPKLRAALHELREARDMMKKTVDAYPPQERERAIRAINDAIETVKTILAVKDVENFRGVDRNPEFYKKYKDHPGLRAVLEDVRDARDELRSAKSDFGGLKDRALEDLDVAAGCIVTLIRH